MRLALTVVSPTARHWADVVVDADPATPVGELAAELDRLAHGGFAGQQPPTGPGHAQVLQFPGPQTHGSLAMAGPVVGHAQQAQAVPLYIDYQVVPPRLSLAQSPLRDGSVISLGSPEGCVYPEPTGLIEIRVAGGPAAGAVHRLSLGEATIGSGQAVTVRLRRQVPEFALHITVDRHGGCEVAAYQGAQVTLEGEPLNAPVQWQPGQQIAVGATLLGLAPYEPPDAALHPSEDGAGIDFNRPPRLLPAERVTRFSCQRRQPRMSGGRFRC